MNIYTLIHCCIKNLFTIASKRGPKLTGKNRGGWLLIAVKTNLQVKRIHLFDITNFYCEYVWLKIKVPYQKAPLQTGVFYFPPNTDHSFYSLVYDALTEYFHSTISDCPIVVQGNQKVPSDKNFEILLKNYFLLKNFYNHRLCWNCPPPIACHTSNRRIVFWNARLQVCSSMLCIHARVDPT